MSAIRQFDFKGNMVRVVGSPDDPWFVLIDACRELGLKNSRQAATRLDEDEKDYVILNDAIGRDRRTMIVSLSGLSALFFQSRKPEAIDFQRWVRKDLLVQLWKTGKVELLPHDAPDPFTPAPMDRQARDLAILEHVRLTQGPAEAARLYETMPSMPRVPKALPKAIDADALDCFRHLLRQQWENSTVGALIEQMFRGSQDAKHRLDRLKIKVCNRGFLVPNVHMPFNKLYDDSPWPRPFEVLVKLPGAEDHNPLGGRSAKDVTWIPSTALDLV